VSALGRKKAPIGKSRRGNCSQKNLFYQRQKSPGATDRRATVNVKSGQQRTIRKIAERAGRSYEKTTTEKEEKKRDSTGGREELILLGADKTNEGRVAARHGPKAIVLDLVGEE